MTTQIRSSNTRTWWYLTISLLVLPLPGICQVNLNVFQPGIISTGDFESHISFSPDGRELYFIKSAPDFSTWTICVSYWKNNAWSTPAIAPFSGKYNDADPFITQDGKRLYFISDRPVLESDSQQKDLDIWYLNKTPAGWSAPIRMDSTINSPANEWYPTLASNGNLYFGSERANGVGRCDLYFARYQNGKYLAAENLGKPVNSEFNEYEPFILPDESSLIFMGIRPGSGRSDLFFTYKKNGAWTPPQSLKELNSPGSEYSPSITHDKKYFFFASTRSTIQSGTQLNYEQLVKQLNSPGNSLGDIYFVSLEELNRLLLNYKKD